MVGEEAEVVADADHAARGGTGGERLRGFLRLSAGRSHGVAVGEGQGDADTAKKMAAVEGLAGRDVGRAHSVDHLIIADWAAK